MEFLLHESNPKLDSKGNALVLSIVQESRDDSIVLVLCIILFKIFETLARVDPHSDRPDWVTVFTSCVLPLELVVIVDIEETFYRSQLHIVKVGIELFVAMLGY